MDKTVLLVTFLVELLLGMFGFISAHLRAIARRRRLRELPGWRQVPFDFRTDYFTTGFEAYKGVKPPKVRKPRSGLL